MVGLAVHPFNTPIIAGAEMTPPISMVAFFIASLLSILV
jgi:hypothetical protein